MRGNSIGARIASALAIAGAAVVEMPARAGMSVGLRGDWLRIPGGKYVSLPSGYGVPRPNGSVARDKRAARKAKSQRRHRAACKRAR